ncbi:MAG: DotI/IcmL/TraM family protein [Gammaproteobacteria bacterium]|nr:DotI/IcmL/TraM family protein [Gammaproteobacteria bacterium]
MRARKLLTQSNGFYQRYYHYFFIGLMGVICLLMAMIGLILYQMFNRPLPSFIAKQSNQEKMVLRAYDAPNLLPETILRWASKAATTAYSFDYVNYNNQLKLARPYFTDAGWQMFLTSVQKLIDSIVQNQLFVNGVVAGTPVISNQGPLPGREYVWRVQIPFLVIYQSANTTSKSNYYVILSLVRVPTYVNPQGIGIDQFIMAQT